MPTNQLIIKGARQNNLKNVSLTLPHDRVIAVTGVSGSGKSSLAFETIFAEGQWRFIESLSTYARLFLEKLDRPDVDSIENIRPAIALEQRNPVRGSRSTVGTLTELYDYLRLLYARAATPYCPGCGEEIVSWDASAIVADLLGSREGLRAFIMFKTGASLAELRQRGFVRIAEGPEVREIETLIAERDPGAVAARMVVMDRLVIRDEPRLGDSVEGAFREGHGRVTVRIVDGPEIVYTEGAACGRCDISLPEPTPLLFSFNHPVGACPECKGFGNVLHYSEALVIPDQMRSIKGGAIEPWEKPAAHWWKRQVLKGARKAGLDINTPYRDLPETQKEMLRKGTPQFYGIEDFFEELEGKRYKLHVRVFLARYREGLTCPRCHGRRLSPGALAYKIDGMDIASLAERPIGDLVGLFAGPLGLSPMRRSMVREVLRQISLKLGFLDRVGLGYLTLSREGKTLSGGEYQRVNLSNQLASNLTGTLYVLDEPTVGLHPRDTRLVSEIMGELAGGGNTIIVVEHDRDVIERADWVVELGPGGGQKGGEIVYAGPMDGFMASGTLTARYMAEDFDPTLGRRPRPASRFLELTGASGHNLRRPLLRIPLGTLTAVTGVSGSGKSTLIVDTLYKALGRELRQMFEAPLPYESLAGHEPVRAVRLMDQAPIGRSPRSNPVTYLKLFDPIRKLFASTPEALALGMGPGHFSFNVEGGRCEACKGEGYQRLEMYFFEDLYVKCEECGGRRYKDETLRVNYLGRNIHEVLELTVEEAMGMFSDPPQIAGRLALLCDVGLGYLRLGQPATTLSGGEAQRLKICAELGMAGGGGPQAGAGILYILDEPTVGLHPMDVEALLRVLHRLVDAGGTVLVIEHNLDLIASADWVVDLGPGGGTEGGLVVAEGRPETVAATHGSHTGAYLRELYEVEAS